MRQQAIIRGEYRSAPSRGAAIISGELTPGTLVSVPTLASQFAVSTTPVREAMLDLEQRRFVASVRNKGFRVTEVSEQDLREIVELRQLIEVPAMRSLAGAFPVETLPQWHALATQIATHADNANLTRFIESDRDFHLGLYGNERLVEIVRELCLRTRMVDLARMTKSDELAATAKLSQLQGRASPIQRKHPPTPGRQARTGGSSSLCSRPSQVTTRATRTRKDSPSCVPPSTNSKEIGTMPSMV